MVNEQVGLDKAAKSNTKSELQEEKTNKIEGNFKRFIRNFPGKEQKQVEGKVEGKKQVNIWIPTILTEWIFSIILLAVLLISLITFPFTKMFSAAALDTAQNIGFNVGWPMTFFELSITNPTAMPIHFFSLIVDLLLYFIIAYLLDVAISFARLKFFPDKTEEEKRKEQEEKERIKKLGNVLEKEPRDSNEIYNNAKKAYEYYKKKGVSDQNIIELFKDKGWKEQTIKDVLQIK